MKKECVKLNKFAVLIAVAAVIAASVWAFGRNDNSQMRPVTIKKNSTEAVQKELPVSKTEEELLSNLYGTMVNGAYADTAAAQEEIGAIIQIGAAVASMINASLPREILWLSVTGRITLPTVRQLK